MIFLTFLIFVKNKFWKNLWNFLNFEKYGAYLIVHLPLLVAKMTMGAMVDSSPLCRYVKHSMSSMCTSSIKSTPGTSSAIPWSMYLFTTLLISFRSLSERNINKHINDQCKIFWVLILKAIFIHKMCTLH